jgi:hypothetical protein
LITNVKDTDVNMRFKEFVQNFGRETGGKVHLKGTKKVPITDGL